MAKMLLPMIEKADAVVKDFLTAEGVDPKPLFDVVRSYTITRKAGDVPTLHLEIPMFSSTPEDKKEV